MNALASMKSLSANRRAASLCMTRPLRVEDLPDPCLHAQHPAFTGDAATAITSASLPSSHAVMPSVKDHHEVDIAA